MQNDKSSKLRLRQQKLRFLHILGVVAVLVFAASISLSASVESLWVDELHTAWVLFGNEGSFTERATVGNQTSAYFWILKICSKLSGQQPVGMGWPSPELSMRLPSIISWLVALVLVGRYSRFRVRSFFLFPMIWIAADRIQWFYATEARPYAILELVLLLGWCIIDSFGAKDEAKTINEKATTARFIVAWTIVAAISIHLHLTAALPITAQWVVGVWLIRRHAMPLWLMSGSLVLLSALPILPLAWPVWQRREMWESFASDTSVNNTLSLFPFVSLLLPVAVAILLDHFSNTKQSPEPNKDDTTKSIIIWSVAAFAPILIAWIVTGLGIAPIYHRRFLIGSALPLVIITSLMLVRVRNGGLRTAAAITVTLAIVISQGTFDLWRHGVFVGKLRNEDWRGAAAWISDRSQPTDIVCCSSGLIEANQKEIPLSKSMSDYLSFPMRSIYHFDHNSSGENTVGLVSDEILWRSQISIALKEASDIAASAQPKRIWIVYRGAHQRFVSRLQTLAADNGDQTQLSSEDPIQKFGNVFVAGFRISTVAANKNSE